MKKVLTFILVLGAAGATLAQGTFNGNTSNSDPNGDGSGGSIYDWAIVDNSTPTGYGYASGNGYKAQYYVGTSSGLLIAQGSPGGLGTGNTIGYYMPGTVTTTFGAGTSVIVQLKAWRGTASSYENAQNAGAGAGTSGLINLTLNPSTTPGPNITTMGNIIIGVLIPEPTTIVLGLMGISALFLGRRKVVSV